MRAISASMRAIVSTMSTWTSAAVSVYPPWGIYKRLLQREYLIDMGYDPDKPIAAQRL
jgi:hypothetical protein